MNVSPSRRYVVTVGKGVQHDADPDEEHRAASVTPLRIIP
jgi:hypothetical protein